jgi:hypothetical protein
LETNSDDIDDECRKDIVGVECNGEKSFLLIKKMACACVCVLMLNKVKKEKEGRKNKHECICCSSLRGSNLDFQE